MSFSLCVFSHVLGADKLFTLGDFAKFLEKAFPNADSRPVIAVVNNVVDWKGLLADCISSFKGLKRPHAFRFKVCEAKGQRFVGMQYREFASETGTPWLGHNGSSNDADAIPVFSALPRTAGTLPLLNDPVHLSPTLEANVKAFQDYFIDANAVIDRKTAATLGKQTIEWFRSVIDTKTLGASLSKQQSPGVGSAATLPAPVFKCNAQARLIGADAKLAIPVRESGPDVVAWPDWAKDVTQFQLSLPEFSAAEQKARVRAKKARANAKELRKARLEALKTSSSDSLSGGAHGDFLSDCADTDADASEMDAKEEKGTRPKRRKRRRASGANSESDPNGKMTVAAEQDDSADASEAEAMPHADKKQRSGVTVLPMDDKRDADLLSKLSFDDIQGMIAKNQRLDVVCAVSGRDQRVWRVSTIDQDRDNRTFSVCLFQFREIPPVTVPAYRLRRHTVMVPSD